MRRVLEGVPVWAEAARAGTQAPGAALEYDVDGVLDVARVGAGGFDVAALELAVRDVLGDAFREELVNAFGDSGAEVGEFAAAGGYAYGNFSGQSSHHVDNGGGRAASSRRRRRRRTSTKTG